MSPVCDFSFDPGSIYWWYFLSNSLSETINYECTYPSHCHVLVMKGLMLQGLTSL